MSELESGKIDKKDLKLYTSRNTFVAAMVAHFSVFLFTTFITYTAIPGSSLFSWHPFLMTIAFVVFMTEGILMFSQQSGLIRGDRKLQVRSHWLFQVAMVICAVGGFLVIYVNKNNYNKNHFTSWHGLLGLVLLISCSGQALAGLALLYPTLLFKMVTLAQAKIYHATYGLFNYTLLVLVLNLGLWSNWASGNITGAAWYGCVACVDILGLVVMTQVTNNVLPRLRSTNRM